MEDVLLNGHVLLADTLRWVGLILGFFIFGMNLTMLGCGWASYFGITRRHPLILTWIVGQQALIMFLLVEMYLNIGTPLRVITFGAVIAFGLKFLAASGVFVEMKRRKRRRA